MYVYIYIHIYIWYPSFYPHEMPAFPQILSWPGIHPWESCEMTKNAS